MTSAYLAHQVISKFSQGFARIFVKRCHFDAQLLGVAVVSRPLEVTTIAYLFSRLLVFAMKSGGLSGELRITFTTLFAQK